MISGPRPAPALSSGSIFISRTFVPRSDEELTPDFHLKSAFVPMEPHLKYLRVVSLNSSMNGLCNPLCCALLIRLRKNNARNKLIFFILSFLIREKNSKQDSSDSTQRHKI